MIESAVGLTLEMLAEKFGAKMIKKFEDRRSKNFFNTFVREIAKDEPASEKGMRMLDDILASESKRDVLFEAYRSVALSRSSIYGPRAIGILTAQIVAEEREATKDEVLWLEVYETLSDIELLGLCGYFKDAFAGRTFKHSRRDRLVLTEYNRGDDESPFHWQTEIGSWARKLHNLGIIWTLRQESIHSKTMTANGASRLVPKELIDEVAIPEKYEKFGVLIEIILKDLEGK